MKLQAVAPESFISKRIESKYVSSLVHELACISLNDAIEMAVASTGISVLAHDRQWQCTDARDCEDQEHSRKAFQVFHDCSSLVSADTEWRVRVRLRFRRLEKLLEMGVTFLKLGTLYYGGFSNYGRCN